MKGILARSQQARVNKALESVFCFVFVFSFCGCTHNMWKVLGQELNLHYSSNPYRCSDKTRSSTCCTHRRTPQVFLEHYFLRFMKLFLNTKIHLVSLCAWYLLSYTLKETHIFGRRATQFT